MLICSQNVFYARIHYIDFYDPLLLLVRSQKIKLICQGLEDNEFLIK